MEDGNASTGNFFPLPKVDTKGHTIHISSKNSNFEVHVTLRSLGNQNISLNVEVVDSPLREEKEGPVENAEDFKVSDEKSIAKSGNGKMWDSREPA